MLLEIFKLVVMVFSLVLHEVSHGFAALSLGDDTAKSQGRLSLNPLKHLDLLGSVIIPLSLYLMGSQVLIGWAKPVPVNPYKLKDQKLGVLKVSLAGPLANFSLALVFALILRLLPLPGDLSLLLQITVLYNLMFGFFNLVPLPPLDGSGILFSLLPERFSNLKSSLYQYGPWLLLIFVFFGFRILDIFVFWAYRLLLGV